MRISESWVGMAAKRSSLKTVEEHESMQVMVRSIPSHDRATISSKARECSDCEIPSIEGDPDQGFRHSLKALLVEILSGRKVHLLDPSSLTRESAEAPADATPAEGAPQRAGWGMIYEESRTFREQEEVSLAAAGVVRTTDGREIAFQLELHMSREFMEHHHIRIQAGDPALIDPLVINYGGGAAELSNLRFAFDLDADGTDDAMPGLAQGSAYLALDRDENGSIDNGTELFGPGTGSGFAELAEMDRDGNGWIDEGDDVFDRLTLWEMDESGERWSGLRERGVGAIFLGNLDAPFDLKDSSNHLEGRIARHGIFLREDGTAGTVQELDVTA